MQMPQLPLDPAVRVGKLENGLTYYIRHNNLPENRADFYFLQKSGSIVEEDNERGLAHFTEHMAFNGTKNFPGKGILNYLQRHGCSFGGNVNAGTGFDQTMYFVTDVPTSAEHVNIVDSCLLVLHDWCAFISLEGEEIDAERGVIHEEWRVRNDAMQRIRENTIFPKMMPETKYGQRSPIGTMEVVDNFPHDVIRNFYKKWYRPDLQGVVIVGDVDVDAVEAKIKEMWKDIPAAAADAPVRVYEQVNDNKEILIGIGKDKENTYNEILFGFKTDKLPFEMRNTQVGYISYVLQSIMTSCFNTRLSEEILKGDCPVQGGGLSYGDYLSCPTKESLMAEFAFRENEWKPALDLVIDMINTVKTYGFTPSEIGRAKAEMLSRYENAYNERDKRKNGQLTQPLINNFYEGYSVLDPEMDYQILQQLLEALPIEAYNQTFAQLITDEKQFALVIGQDKEGNVLPTEEELAAAIKEGLAREAKPYEEKEVASSFLESLPKAGKVTKTEDAAFGFKVWTLSNGAKVVWKQTDFKKDQILMEAVSPVGTLNLSGLNKAENQYISTAFSYSGFGNYSVSDVQKMLAGKQVNVDLGFDKNYASVSGKSTPKDLRTMFEMIYLTAIGKRYDQEAFDGWFKRQRNNLEKQIGTPNKILSDSLMITLFKDNTERYPITLEEFDQLNYKNMVDKSYELIKNAADFTFFFIGNIDEDSLKMMSEQYLAALPSTGKATKNYKRDYKSELFTAGSRECRFELEMEQPQVTVYNVFGTYNQPYDMKEQIALQAYSYIMQMVFTETIRERESGVYSPASQAGYHTRGEYMQMLYMFVTNAEMVEHLEDVAYKETLNALDNITDDHFQKACDYLLKTYQQNQIENGYWLSLIQEQVRFGQDKYTGYEEALKSLTKDDVKAVGKKIVGGDRVQFVANGVKK